MCFVLYNNEQSPKYVNAAASLEKYSSQGSQQSGVTPGTPPKFTPKHLKGQECANSAEEVNTPMKSQCTTKEMTT